MHNRNKFPWRQFLKSVAVIAIPVALQNLLTTTASMVDTIMIAPLGENSVGAIGLCAQFSSLMFAGYWGFVGGGTLFFSQYWGAKDDDGICRSYGMTLTCMMAVGLFFGILAVTNPELIMRIYTDKPALQEIGVQYLRIAGFAYPMQVFSMAMSTLLRSTEKVRIPLYGSIASVAVNLFLNWVFIFGNLGAPAMGVRGAALATLCAAVVNVSTIAVFAKATGNPHIFKFSRHFRWTGASTSEYFTKCFPIICNEVLIGVGNMVINIVLGRQSEEAIAAIAVYRVLEGLVIGFFGGFSNASSVLVGKCVGSGELRTAYERAWRIVYMCASVIFLTTVTLVLVRRPLLTAMSLSGQSYIYACSILFVYVIIATLRLSNWTQNDTFRASGDSTYGTVLEIAFMYALVLPCVCVSGFVLKVPFIVLFICCYIDEPIRFVLMQRHLYSGKWIRPVTPQGIAAHESFLAELRAEKK